MTPTGGWSRRAGLVLLLGLAWAAPLTAQVSLPNCTDRLQFLRGALKLYADAHNGSLPQQLSVLYTDRYVATELWAFWCPLDGAPKLPDGIDTHGSFELSAQTYKPTSDQPLLTERDYHHEMTQGGQICVYRHVLLQNGQILLQPRPATVSQERDTTPPRICFEGEAPRSWEPYEEIVYRWTATDDRTPQERLQYRTNTSWGGLSEWSDEVGGNWGRLRPGEHVLEVWARDEAGTISPQPASVRFRVLARNVVFRMEPAERWMKPYAKAPRTLPPPARWVGDYGSLRRVDLSLTAPKRQAAGSQAEEAEADDGLFMGADEEQPGVFYPRQTPRRPLVFARHFQQLHLVFRFDSRDTPNEIYGYRFRYEGRDTGELDLPAREPNERTMDVPCFLANGASFPVGRYEVQLKLRGQVFCHLYFNVVDPQLPNGLRQALSDPGLAGLRTVRGRPGEPSPREGVVRTPPLVIPGPAPGPEVTSAPATGTSELTTKKHKSIN